MIYMFFEGIATLAECFILYFFLITTLGFKLLTRKKITIVTSGFVILTLVNAFIWDNFSHLFNLEYMYALSYILILLTFSRVILQGEWWNQAVLILISISSIFLINLILTIISGLILNNSYSEVLLMRNPARIFLLVFSKLALYIILASLSNALRKFKLYLQVMQCISAIIIFTISITIYNILEKMLFDNVIPFQYATVIMTGFAVIVLMLFFIISQILRNNQAELNRTALQTKLHDDEEKLNELIQWSKSVRTIQHDLSNHMVSVKQLIKEEKYEQTIEYIEQIEKNISGIPRFTDTNCSALNAILDTKRAICRQENIDLKCYLQSDLPETDNYAFSAVFGNLFDNAIEAEKNESEKAIRLAVETFRGCIRITMQNRINKPVLVDGKLPATTKKDTYNHGLGMYSVTDIINKSDGAIDMYEDRGWLVIDVLLPVTKQTRGN